ncbi:MAG: single-stranded-DNA-specific exonuclease RecJ [Deltaproteobacteria bacterium]|nr:single-stranded-DNA-specific exonuclease RecJ [Deltaproteobacteria bacterium]
MIWQIKEDPYSASSLARKLGVSKLLASLLMHRNITSTDSARSFLFPKLGVLRDPFLLKDMDSATELIKSFIDKKKKITIYGDYDADGITATSLLYDFFSHLKIPISFYIPHRLKEGYSLNETAVREIAEDGTDLIITVDCGINSFSEITLAHKLRMEVIVTDHHQPPLGFKPLCPTINPLRPDCPFPFKELSGVGLAFYLAIAIRSKLRDTGFFQDTGEPDLRVYLGLVAIGTIADIVPLIEENRILVKSGLTVLTKIRKPGINALLRVSGIKNNQAITTHDVAFKLAPRLNAIGRLESATRAVHLLTTDDEAEASSIAIQMDSLNAQRQKIQSEIVSECRKKIDKMEGLEKHRTIVLSDPQWHRGVIGIVASKIVDEYCRPTLLFTDEGDLLKGSGRSMDGFDLYKALSGLSDLLTQFGGHEYAAGVALESKNMEEFCDRFEELASKKFNAKDMAPKIEVDARLGLESINPQVVQDIEMLFPFGHQNPQPIFWAGPVKVVFSTVVGNDHLKLTIKEKGTTFDCIAFGKAPLHPLKGKVVDILFHVEMNTWQGIESIQLVIVDIRLN